MSMPRETDYGKGDANRSDFLKFQNGFSRINFGTSQINYLDSGDDYWFNGEGWYFSNEIWEYIGPFNTWASARNALREYCRRLFNEEEVIS